MSRDPGDGRVNPLNADATNHSRTGGATMRMPAANFSQNGLASIFGIRIDDDTKPPTNEAHKRTAIIAGTICGIVVVAVLVGLGWYVVRKKKSITDEPYYEKDGHTNVHREVVEPVELQAGAPSELPVQDGPLPVREG